MSDRTALRTSTVLAAAAALALLGCGDGLDFDNDSLPRPSVAVEPAPATCVPVGGGRIEFELQDLRLFENYPADVPQERLEIRGTVSGLNDGDQVAVVIVDQDVICPLIGTAEATVEGSTFSVIADFGSRTAFQAFLVAHAGTLADLDCDAEAGCLGTAAGSFTAVSQAVDVHLN